MRYDDTFAAAFCVYLLDLPEKKRFGEWGGRTVAYLFVFKAIEQDSIHVVYIPKIRINFTLNNRTSLFHHQHNSSKLLVIRFSVIIMMSFQYLFLRLLIKERRFLLCQSHINGLDFCPSSQWLAIVYNRCHHVCTFGEKCSLRWTENHGYLELTASLSTDLVWR